MAPLVRTGGSRHTGLAALPHRNIHFKILSITDTRFDEQFGFTDREVKDLLSYYNVEDKFKETKEWYDGYRFGNVDIYCPWDVINYVDRIKDDPGARPEAFWINTSGNG